MADRLMNPADIGATVRLLESRPRNADLGSLTFSGDDGDGAARVIARSRSKIDCQPQDWDDALAEVAGVGDRHRHCPLGDRAAKSTSEPTVNTDCCFTR